MLSLLDQDSQYSYRVPISLTNLSDPYILAAYLASMRFSSRFNEAQGSLVQYLKYYGYEPNYHVGQTTDRMKQAMLHLVSNRILQGHKTDVRTLKPNQHFCFKFNPGWGWRYKTYPLSVLFQIRELDRAANKAKRNRWGNQNGLIDVLHLTAYLRSYLETTTDTIAPADRWAQAIAIVDLDSSLELMGLSERRFMNRLERMKTVLLGAYERVNLKGPTRAENKRLLLYVNYSREGHDKKALNKAKRNLRAYYQNCELTEG